VATVFINYRRADSDVSAGSLYDTLESRLSDLRIFMDVDDIPPGEDFGSVLRAALAETDLLIVVIGPAWLSVRNEKGLRRLDEPGDFVALEIAEALGRQIAILPVLVQGARMPPSASLPLELQALTKYQGVELGTRTWDRDVEGLIERLEELLAEQLLEEQPGRVARPPWQRLLAGVDMFRRRFIRSSRAWRRVKQVSLLALTLLVVAGAYMVGNRIRTADRRAMERALRLVTYENSADTVASAVETLRQVAARSKPEMVDQAVAHLKSVVLNQANKSDDGRAIRKHAIETIKMLRQHNLTLDFSNDELDEVDLVSVDLSRASLKGVSMSGAFLIRSDFSGGDLSGTDLSGSWIRNGDFDACTLAGVDLTGVDWFNAHGFSISQLREAKIGTVESCPKDASGIASVSAFRERFAVEYQFSLESIGGDRDRLLGLWEQYAGPNGLCAQVDALRSGANR
jgi:uncharacterized protein YjbI with pentapeptide repeats